MPPTRPARTISSSAVPAVGESASALGVPLEFWILTTALVTVSATSTREERADEVEDGGQGDGDLGPQCAGGDGGGHRVRGVVEPVREVETESRDDHQSQHHECVCHTAIVALRRPVSKT